MWTVQVQVVSKHVHLQYRRSSRCCAALGGEFRQLYPGPFNPPDVAEPEPDPRVIERRRWTPWKK